MDIEQLAGTTLGNFENDHGFEWLGNACEERGDWLLQMAKSPILLDFLNIQSDPRYIALLKKIGLDK